MYIIVYLDRHAAAHLPLQCWYAGHEPKPDVLINPWCPKEACSATCNIFHHGTGCTCQAMLWLAGPPTHMGSFEQAK